MLPDLPVLKSEISRALHQWFRSRVFYYATGVAGIQQTHIFEGGPSSILRADGKEDVTAMQRMSASFSIERREIVASDLPAVLRRMDEAARQMAQQVEKSLYKTVSDAAEAVGNTVDARGKTFSPDVFFEMLEKIWVDFDKNGQPQWPEIHLSPALQAGLESTLKEIDSTPALAARFEELTKTKKRSWNAREAARKLVG